MGTQCHVILRLTLGDTVTGTAKHMTAERPHTRIAMITRVARLDCSQHETHTTWIVSVASLLPDPAALR